MTFFRKVRTFLGKCGPFETEKVRSDDVKHQSDDVKKKEGPRLTNVINPYVTEVERERERKRGPDDANFVKSCFCVFLSKQRRHVRAERIISKKSIKARLASELGSG